MSSTTTDTASSIEPGEAAADQNLTGLADVISQLAEDKSHYWSTEVATLTAVEKELLAAREELETYRVNIGSLNSLVAMSRYARLGKYTAALLGSREEWQSSDMTADIATMWSAMDSRNIGGQSDEELVYWRRIADDLGIRHDGEDTDAVEPAEDTAEDTAAAANAGAHVATYIPVHKLPKLFNVICSCGESSFGASLRDSAEIGHKRHVANPSGGSYRDAETTARLYTADVITLARNAATTPKKELS